MVPKDAFACSPNQNNLDPVEGRNEGNNMVSLNGRKDMGRGEMRGAAT